MADTKITALTAIDAVAAADLVVLVDDVAGTPVNKKATVTQLFTDPTVTTAINLPNGSAGSPSLKFGDAYMFASGGIGFVPFGGSSAAGVTADGTSAFAAGSALPIGWSSSTNAVSAVADTRLYRDAAYIIAQRNGTNAQSFRLYNTYTDASNYERGVLEWDTNVLRIGNQAAGTGSDRAIELFAANGTCWLSKSGGAHNGVMVWGDSSIITLNDLIGFRQNNSTIFVASDVAFGWSSTSKGNGSGNFGGSDNDTKLFRDGAAGVIAQRNGTNAQAFRIYNTYTDASNYERMGMYWSSNQGYVAQKAEGTGSYRTISYGTDPYLLLDFVGGQRMSLNSSGNSVLCVNNSSVITASSSGKLGFADGNADSGTIDANFIRVGAGIVGVRNDAAGGALSLIEQTAPSAPAANGVYLYAVDNGAGKTQLMALFASGAAQQVAIEP